MTRTYGRIAQNQRLILPCPYARGSKYSIISAISICEVMAALYTNGSVDSQIFLHFLEYSLVPNLKPNQTIILDNVSFHKVKGVKELIESTGARVLYLPPYSPDLSPIENMW
jgi:transposase